jgi:hypothetical protein
MISAGGNFIVCEVLGGQWGMEYKEGKGNNRNWGIKIGRKNYMV